MSDKDIIKSLECCATYDCDNCPSNQFDCDPRLQKDALALINRQEAYIMELQAINESRKEDRKLLLAEIERLKETPKCVYAYDGEAMEYCVEAPCHNYKTADEIRAEAIKEFAERLIKKLFPYGMPDNGNYGINAKAVSETINRLVKEMVGDEE